MTEISIILSVAEMPDREPPGFPGCSWEGGRGRQGASAIRVSAHAACRLPPYFAGHNCHVRHCHGGNGGRLSRLQDVLCNVEWPMPCGAWPAFHAVLLAQYFV